jgi:hypothetical protein
MTDPTQLVGLSLALVLTGPGMLPASFFVRQLVEYLRGSLPLLANVNGLLLAFILNAILYAAAWVFVGSHTPEGAFASVLVWLGAGVMTKGVHDGLGDRLTVPQAK